MCVCIHVPTLSDSKKNCWLGIVFLIYVVSPFLIPLTMDPFPLHQRSSVCHFILAMFWKFLTWACSHRYYGKWDLFFQTPVWYSFRSRGVSYFVVDFKIWLLVSSCGFVCSFVFKFGVTSFRIYLLEKERERKRERERDWLFIYWFVSHLPISTWAIIRYFPAAWRVRWVRSGCVPPSQALGYGMWFSQAAS